MELEKGKNPRQINKQQKVLIINEESNNENILIKQPVAVVTIHKEDEDGRQR